MVFLKITSEFKPLRHRDPEKPNTINTKSKEIKHRARIQCISARPWHCSWEPNAQFLGDLMLCYFARLLFYANETHTCLYGGLESKDLGSSLSTITLLKKKLFCHCLKQTGLLQ